VSISDGKCLVWFDVIACTYQALQKKHKYFKGEKRMKKIDYAIAVSRLHLASVFSSSWLKVLQ